MLTIPSFMLRGCTCDSSCSISGDVKTVDWGCVRFLGRGRFACQRCTDFIHSDSIFFSETPSSYSVATCCNIGMWSNFVLKLTIVQNRWLQLLWPLVKSILFLRLKISTPPPCSDGDELKKHGNSLFFT